MSFLSTFLLTFQSFTNSEDLLKKLVERYRVPASIDDKTRSTIRLRVVVFLKHWIEKVRPSHYRWFSVILTQALTLCLSLQSFKTLSSQNVMQDLYDFMSKDIEARLFVSFVQFSLFLHLVSVAFVTEGTNSWQVGGASEAHHCRVHANRGTADEFSV